MNKFHSRFAEKADEASITALMELSISTLQNDFLNPDQVKASFEIMGLDTKLIEDKTYFVFLHNKMLVGCGGWSRRATLFGGDHTNGRNDSFLDPTVDAAKIRAMYTHPDWKRQGIGRLILALCEEAAQKAGFTRVEMMATLSGQPLYQAAGYEPLQNVTAKTSHNIEVPLVKMTKVIQPNSL